MARPGSWTSCGLRFAKTPLSSTSTIFSAASTCCWTCGSSTEKASALVDDFSKPAPWSAMGYRITLDRGVLRAELFGRETVEETKTFFRAIVSASSETRSPCILISVRSSKPVFQLERHGLIEYFRELAVTSSPRIALLGDSRDLRLSHEYIELIARQHGLSVRSFPDETAAYQWFRDPRQRQERRGQHERRSQQALRAPQERRAGE